MKVSNLTFLFLLICSSLTGQSYFDSTWTNYFRLNSGGWTAGDATISVRLPDNRVMWLFGDSYIVPVNVNNNTLPCLFQVRNCYMVQDSADPSAFITIIDTTQTGVNQTTFKLALNDTTLLWPGAGYVRNDTIYIFLENYSSSTYEYKGCYLAKLEFPSLHLIGIFPVHDNSPAIYGRAVIADEEQGILYIFGNKLNWIIQEPVVARCNIENPLGPWEYFAGTSWSIFPERVQKISDDPVSPGFSVFPYENRYILVTQENGYLECDLGREIYSMESVFPWGPYENKRLLYTEESTFNGHYLLTYNAQAHPWSTGDGELLISYNVNDRVDSLVPHVCPSQCVNIFTDRLDADTYRPKFIRVPMALITGRGEAINQIHRLTVTPNPAAPSGDVDAAYSLTQTCNGTLSIFDLTGRVISSSSIKGNPGINHFKFQAPHERGIYILCISFSGEMKSVRISVC